MKTISGRQAIEERCPDLLFDESRFTLGVPEKVCFPRTHADVAAIALEASASGRPITLIGAQTGITGGATPIDDCIAVCFSEMNAITRFDWTDPAAPILYCQPGVTLADITAFLNNPQRRSGAVEGGSGLTSGQWFYPPDPTEMTAQLGGSVATNASGARSYFFGPTRRYISALSMVFAGGDALTIRRGEVSDMDGHFNFVTMQGRKISLRRPDYDRASLKNAAGYYSCKGMDLIDLFIGSEGTLAMFTEIGIRLVKVQRFIGGLSFFPTRVAAFDFADFLRNEPQVIAIEFFDCNALRFVRNASDSSGRAVPGYPDSTQAAVYWEFSEDAAPFEQRMEVWEQALSEHGSSFEKTWSGFDKKEMDMLKWFRHSVPEMINATMAGYKKNCPDIRKISTDAAVPASRFREFTEQCVALAQESNLPYALFGHLGDFHVHCNLLPRSAEELSQALRIYETIMDSICTIGATVSAEHGIGKIKKKYLARQYGPKAMEEMARVKAQLDPQWILNRGNLFDRLPHHIL